MSEPIAQVAIDAVVGMLSAIRVSAGYYTDIGAGVVTSEPDSVVDPSAAYVAVVETGRDPMTDQSGRAIPRRYYLNLVIEACVPRSGNRPWRQSRRERADIVRVLERGLRDQPAGVLSLSLSGDQRIVDDDRRRANHLVAQVSARVGLSEPKPD